MSLLETTLGPVTLRSPLIAASGTVGAVWDVAGAVDFGVYGAAVAKSVAPEPWPGRKPPRLVPLGSGLLNAIGIQNPGVDAWMAEARLRLGQLPVPVWGSAVAHDVAGFALVAERLTEAGVEAVEINLSCPNLRGGGIFALDPDATRRVIAAVRAATDLPVGAKLSPDAEPIEAVAGAALDAGADWLVLTNTTRGVAFDAATGRPRLGAVTGGWSGPPLKPIALRCVWTVRRAFPEAPIVGTGGVTCGADVVEYLLAGARAVGLGTVHLAEPRAGRRVLRELRRLLTRSGTSVRDLVGAAA